MVGGRTKHEHTNVRKMSLSTRWATCRLPVRSWTALFREPWQQRPIQVARKLTERPNIARLLERMTGPRRHRKTIVRNTLMSTSKERISIVTYRRKPMRHFPSVCEMRDKGAMHARTIIDPNPIVTSELFTIHSQS
jgi:hypothetical protein